MPDTGVRSTNLPSSTIVTEVLGNKDLGGGVLQTVRIPVGNFANILAPYGTHVVFATLSEMNASLAYPANTGGEVWADSTDANNGIYRKIGASGSGSWTWVAPLSTTQILDRIAALEAIGGDANLAAIADLSRPGERPALWSPGTDGNPDDMAIYTDSVVDSDGSVARLVGAQVCAPRAAQRLEPGRRYLVRVKVRRRINTSDPAGDAVNISIRWLTQAKAGLSTTVSTSLTTLTTSSGVVEHQMVISTAAGTGVTALSPSGSVYFRPFVQTFGTLCATDVEVIAIQDITDATAYSPDLTALTGRVTAIESETLPDRVEVLEAAYGTPRKVFFRTYGDFVAATIASSIDTVEILGYYAANDGGGQVFGRGSNVTGAVNVGSDYWERRGNSANFRKFGATGDGSTSDRTACANADAYAAAAGVSLVVSYGTYLIDSSITFASVLDFRGGVLKRGGSATITVAGVRAGRSQNLFMSIADGSIIFASGQERYAEWFGAAGDNTTDDTIPLRAGKTAGPGPLMLDAKTYKVTDTLSITQTGQGYSGVDPGSTIINMTVADKDIIHAYGADYAHWLPYPTVKNLLVYRSVNPTGTATGIRMEYTVHCRLFNVVNGNSVYGFHFKGTGNSLARDCWAIRDIGEEGDSFYGWYFDSSVGSPNPTMVVDSCKAVCFVRDVNSLGFTIIGDDIKDAFLLNPEVASCTYGINISGSADNPNFDIHIEAPILDTIWLACINISNLGTTGLVNINGGWSNSGEATGVASYGLIAAASSGVSVRNHQFFGGPNYANHIGALLSGCSRSAIDGNQFRNCRKSVDLLDTGLTGVGSNKTYNLSSQPADTVIHVRGSSFRNVVTGNILDGTATNSILLTSGATTNQVALNNVNTAAMAAISDLGSGNTVTLNL
ncbi:hypothetical protein V5G24_20440 [Xanthobacter sp. VTT E-85241]|uniref:hypothetical protein n=1 Tax=Roseixanthobacter finlandensis TaxID=3119922 RepID=UPI0037264376